MELIRYSRGILARGLKQSLKTLYYTGEIKYGRIAGTDKFGNTYFENLDEIHGRHRWVEFGDYKNPDPTAVPPEWHSWLHHVSDKTGQDMLPFSPVYKREHYRNPTGTDGAYTPANFLYNIEKAKKEEKTLEKENKN